MADRVDDVTNRVERLEVKVDRVAYERLEQRMAAGFSRMERKLDQLLDRQTPPEQAL